MIRDRLDRIVRPRSRWEARRSMSHSREQIRPIKGPRISVHCLTEFIYCNRAGLICQLDHQQEEEPVEGREADLRFTLLYNAKTIRNELVELLGLVVPVVLLIVIAIALSVLWRPESYFLLAIPVILVLAFGQYIKRAAQLWEQLRASELAEPEVPDWSSKSPQTGNWWSIRKSGFESQKCSEAFFDPAWNLSGSPHLLLRCGNVCIPVMRLKVKRLADGTPILRKQHFARMAAYCHLIKKNLGDVETPCGLFSIRGSYDVLTVPVLPESHTNWKSALNSAREVLAGFRSGHAPAPAEPKLCRSCPHARHRYVEIPTELGGKTFDVHPCADGEFHTCCGDVFRWQTPTKV